VTRKEQQVRFFCKPVVVLPELVVQSWCKLVRVLVALAEA
jgi:hypothetical protein